MLIFVPMSSMYVYGVQIDDGSGYSTEGKTEYRKYETYFKIKESTKEALGLLQNILESSSSNNSNYTNDTNNTNSNNNANSNTNTLYTSSEGRQYTNGSLVMYRQYDYKQPLPGGCTISKAGCGPTAVANILANFHDKSIDPVYVVNRHYAVTGDNYANCKGSYYVGALKALQTPEYRLKTQVKTFKAGL